MTKIRPITWRTIYQERTAFKNSRLSERVATKVGRVTTTVGSLAGPVSGVILGDGYGCAFTIFSLVVGGAVGYKLGQYLGTGLSLTAGLARSALRKAYFPLGYYKLFSVSLVTDINTLNNLTVTGDYYVKKAVALNPHTSENSLSLLANKEPDINIRRTVRNNPVIAGLLKEAETSIDPTRLTELFEKPFRCLQAKVAKNANSPWLLAAKFILWLSIAVEAGKYFEVECGGPEKGTWQPKYRRVDEHIKLDLEILKAHEVDRENIMAWLKQQQNIEPFLTLQPLLAGEKI